MNKGIMIDVEQARQILTLFENVEAADAIYKPCQSTNFRNFVKDTYMAANVQNAYDSLKKAINMANNDSTEE